MRPSSVLVLIIDTGWICCHAMSFSRGLAAPRRVSNEDFSIMTYESPDCSEPSLDMTFRVAEPQMGQELCTSSEFLRCAPYTQVNSATKGDQGTMAILASINPMSPDKSLAFTVYYGSNDCTQDPEGQDTYGASAAEVTKIQAGGCGMVTLSMEDKTETFYMKFSGCNPESSMPTAAPPTTCTDENFDHWSDENCGKPIGPLWNAAYCDQYDFVAGVTCNGVTMREVKEQCGAEGCMNLLEEGRSCTNYCKMHGLTCDGAWMHKHDSCELDYALTCHLSYNTSTICKCGDAIEDERVHATTPAPEPRPDSAQCVSLMERYIMCHAPCERTAAYPERLSGWNEHADRIRAHQVPTPKCIKVDRARMDYIREAGFQPVTCARAAAADDAD
mmetsp:Transcript_88254/g.189429  ORF Transcript_88254/g.189429 Transcript_88254/m.189429 type:complete len:388 (-) Transcript_88254:88-1251(-)